MRAGGTREVATRRRGMVHAGSVVPATPHPHAGRRPTGPSLQALARALAAALAPRPVAQPSRAGGDWEVDWDRARVDALATLAALDLTKRDLTVWVPGTSNHGVHRHFGAALREADPTGSGSVAALQYEASWLLRRSLPTGIATLRLVLEAIAARGGSHRVHLAGESQGAWIVGEVVADPLVAGIVDRALLVGHPWLAAHQYGDGQDPRVRVINHRGDQVTLPVRGDAALGLDAMIAVRTLQWSRLGTVLRGFMTNPLHAVLLLGNLLYGLPVLRGLLQDPHKYGGEMTRAVQFLRTGTMPPPPVDLRAEQRRLEALVAAG